MNRSYKIIVVGAGPAGMMAAIRAGELGQDVILIEKNPSPGKKLILSGKRRCNLTNLCNIESFLKRFSKNGQFLRDAFKIFKNLDLINFFEKRGVHLKAERQQRVFPVSDNSITILDTLQKELAKNKVKVIYNAVLKDIMVEDRGQRSEDRGQKTEVSGQWTEDSGQMTEDRLVIPFGIRCSGEKTENRKPKTEYRIPNKTEDRRQRITGIVLEDGQVILADKVILATGGCFYSFTGSTGDGIKIAEKTNHKIVPPRPGLVPLKIKQNCCRELQGLVLKNIRLKFSDGKRKIVSDIGELLWTHFGISGPLVISLSGRIVDWLREGSNVYVEIDLKPALSFEQLNTRLLREFQSNPKKNIKNVLKNLLPEGLIRVFLEFSQINPEKQVSQISQKERLRMIELLKGFRLDIDGPFSQKAMITRGGVSIKDINPRTMESKIIKGLYFAGEMIDVDADTGGFNLQAAFSTGYLAGESAAQTEEQVSF